jgi:hypothetical protein
VPRGELAEGLKKHGYRYVTPSSGDGSVQVVDAGGKLVRRADLKRVSPSVVKLVGPAAWQAMAMATQQHYLVEISGKLSAIDSKLDELIARDEDKKLSAFNKARSLAAEAQDAIAAREPLSPDRIEELGDHMHRVDDDWRELLQRTERLLETYRAGGGDTGTDKGKAAADVNASWSLLLRATQALAEARTAFAALPQDDAAIAQALRREESERVAGCLDDLRELAEQLHSAHALWQAGRTIHELSRTRNPVELVRRKLTRSELEAGPGPLNAELADIADRLAQPTEPPSSMLVEVRRDGTVLIAAARGRSAPSG